MEALYTDLYVEQKVVRELHLLIPQGREKELVVLCLGTDRSTGDSLGPVTGTFLSNCFNSEKLPQNIPIYGSLWRPVHANNVAECINEIHQANDNPFVLSIDSCVSKEKPVGTIAISAETVSPGSSLARILPEVGDVSIFGVVAPVGVNQYELISSARLYMIMEMARILSYGIHTFLRERGGRQ